MVVGPLLLLVPTVELPDVLVSIVGNGRRTVRMCDFASGDRGPKLAR